MHIPQDPNHPVETAMDRIVHQKLPPWSKRFHPRAQKHLFTALILPLFATLTGLAMFLMYLHSSLFDAGEKANDGKPSPCTCGPAGSTTDTNWRTKQ